MVQRSPAEQVVPKVLKCQINETLLYKNDYKKENVWSEVTMFFDITWDFKFYFLKMILENQKIQWKNRQSVRIFSEEEI